MGCEQRPPAAPISTSTSTPNQHPGTSITCVAFSPDGDFLATSSDDGTVKLWSVATEEETATFHGHTAEVLAVAFSLDGKTLASASVDRTARLWNVATRKEIATLTGHRDIESLNNLSRFWEAPCRERPPRRSKTPGTARSPFPTAMITSSQNHERSFRVGFRPREAGGQTTGVVELAAETVGGGQGAERSWCRRQDERPARGTRGRSRLGHRAGDGSDSCRGVHDGFACFG